LKMGRSTAESECAYINGLEKLLLSVAEKLPNVKFVIRCHPGESDSIWRNLTAKRSNIRVQSEGSLQVWMQAAEKVLYMAGCATGLEAYLAGLPALRFMLDSSFAFPNYGVSAHINQAFSNPEELVDILLNGYNQPHKLASERDRIFVSDHISIEARSSAQRI